MPKVTTTNAKLQQLAKRMRIPYLRGIFMRTTLPIGRVYRNESSIWIMPRDQALIGWHTRSGEIVLFTLIVLAIFDHQRNWCDIGTYLKLNIIARLINVMIKVTVDNCVCNFYRWLTINLKIDIAFFQLSIHSNMSRHLRLPVRVASRAATFRPQI